MTPQHTSRPTDRRRPARAGNGTGTGSAARSGTGNAAGPGNGTGTGSGTGRPRYAARGHRWLSLAAALAVTVTAVPVLPLLTAAPAAADTSTECSSFPAKPYKGRPWSLQRVMLDRLWQESEGEGVRVAVIDTGVDVKNPQLKDAVDKGRGRDFLTANLKKKKVKEEQKPTAARKTGTEDRVGHGTKVAGIIAARPAEGTGVVGLAPKATVIPILQNDEKGNGDAHTLAQSIDYAVSAGAGVINISQDTAEPLRADSELELAVRRAVQKDVVVVASAGNDGLSGEVKETYPAAYPEVLAVAASDRNNERAAFSQSGDFVDVAAPGVDMISTVPAGGHCADNGTSFAAPYVAGVAALLRAKHDDWTPREIAAQIEQTAERSVGGHDRLVGWGVVDPVRALTEDEHPIQEPVAREAVTKGELPTPAKFIAGETPQERRERLATYAVVGGGVLVCVVAGGSVVYRDWRRRRAS